MASASSRCASSAGRPVACQYAFEVLPAGEVGQEAGTLDERADRGQHVGPGVHRLAVDEDLTGVRPDQPDQHPDGRGLARAVRPQQPDHLAGLGAERDPVHRPEPVGVGLHHVGDHERDVGQRGIRVGRAVPPPQPDRAGERGQGEQGHRHDQRHRHVEVVAAQHLERDLGQHQHRLAGQRDRVDGRLLGEGVRLVGGRHHDLQPVLDRHLVGHGRQGHRDPRRSTRSEPGQPDRGDRPVRQHRRAGHRPAPTLRCCSRRPGRGPRARRTGSPTPRWR